MLGICVNGNGAWAWVMLNQLLDVDLGFVGY